MLRVSTNPALTACRMIGRVRLLAFKERPLYGLWVQLAKGEDIGIRQWVASKSFLTGSPDVWEGYT